MNMRISRKKNHNKRSLYRRKDMKFISTVLRGREMICLYNEGREFRDIEGGDLMLVDR